MYVNRFNVVWLERDRFDESRCVERLTIRVVALEGLESLRAERLLLLTKCGDLHIDIADPLFDLGYRQVRLYILLMQSVVLLRTQQHASLYVKRGGDRSGVEVGSPRIHAMRRDRA